MRQFIRRALAFLILFGVRVGSGRAQEAASIRVIGWHLQSDWDTKTKESDPDVLQAQIAKKKGVHLWGLSEVLPENLEKFRAGAEEALGEPVKTILSKSGGRDRLAILYDSTRFELLAKMELGM